ncbi:hypothetical protein BJ878DRAFT_477050 [Calycina marina]|uniref:Uncharacterized protein n=1 Tax=Calycina marina TaxID=1763456 RepID=A0A9P7Z9K6_9HELO|nr:hypothetical protein BJ878DRAFT_477050 [Calycina marina]
MRDIYFSGSVAGNAKVDALAVFSVVDLDDPANVAQEDIDFMGAVNDQVGSAKSDSVKQLPTHARKIGKSSQASCPRTAAQSSQEAKTPPLPWIWQPSSPATANGTQQRHKTVSTTKTTETTTIQWNILAPNEAYKLIQGFLDEAQAQIDAEVDQNIEDEKRLRALTGAWNAKHCYWERIQQPQDTQPEEEDWIALPSALADPETPFIFISRLATLPLPPSPAIILSVRAPSPSTRLQQKTTPETIHKHYSVAKQKPAQLHLDIVTLFRNAKLERDFQRGSVVAALLCASMSVLSMVWLRLGYLERERYLLATLEECKIRFSLLEQERVMVQDETRTDWDCPLVAVVVEVPGRLKRVDVKFILISSSSHFNLLANHITLPPQSLLNQSHLWCSFVAYLNLQFLHLSVSPHATQLITCPKLRPGELCCMSEQKGDRTTIGR